MSNGQPTIPEGMIDEPTEEDKAILLEIEQEAEAKAISEAKVEEPVTPEPEPEVIDDDKGKDDGKTAEEPEVTDGDDDSDVVEDDGKLDEGGKDDEKSESRKPKFVRLQKHLKMRDKVKDLEAKVLELETAKADTPEAKKEAEEAISEAVQELADELGLSTEKATKLLKMTEDGAYNRLKAEFGGKLDALESAEQKSKADAQVVQQEKLWTDQITKLKEQFPDEAEHIQKMRGSIKKMAFSEQYSSTPLDVIYRGVDGLRDIGSKTVESGKGGSTKSGSKLDFGKIASENDGAAIALMDDKTFGEFQEYVVKNNL